MVMDIFIFVYEKNDHGKSWNSHGISFPDLCGNPGIKWDGWSWPGLIQFTQERSRPQGMKNVHNFLMTVREMS